MQTSIVAILSVLVASVVAAPAAPAAPETCTTRVGTFVPFSRGSPTTTVFTSTATAIRELGCGGCSLQIYNIGGRGPVVVSPITPTATVTVDAVKTVQGWRCTEPNAFQTDVVVFKN